MVPAVEETAVAIHIDALVGKPLVQSIDGELVGNESFRGLFEGDGHDMLLIEWFRS